jgi:hypothetical protein
MLVYDGRKNLEENLGCLQVKINSHPAMQLHKTIPQRTLIWNRMVALAALVSINAVTYLAIKLLLNQ